MKLQDCIKINPETLRASVKPFHGAPRASVVIKDMAPHRESLEEWNSLPKREKKEMGVDLGDIASYIEPEFEITGIEDMVNRANKKDLGQWGKLKGKGDYVECLLSDLGCDREYFSKTVLFLEQEDFELQCGFAVPHQIKTRKEWAEAYLGGLRGNSIKEIAGDHGIKTSRTIAALREELIQRADELKLPPAYCYEMQACDDAAEFLADMYIKTIEAQLDLIPEEFHPDVWSEVFPEFAVLDLKIKTKLEEYGIETEEMQEGGGDYERVPQELLDRFKPVVIEEPKGATVTDRVIALKIPGISESPAIGLSKYFGTINELVNLVDPYVLRKAGGVGTKKEVALMSWILQQHEEGGVDVKFHPLYDRFSRLSGGIKSDKEYWKKRTEKEAQLVLKGEDVQTSAKGAGKLRERLKEMGIERDVAPQKEADKEKNTPSGCGIAVLAIIIASSAWLFQ